MAWEPASSGWILTGSAVRWEGPVVASSVLLVGCDWLPVSVSFLSKLPPVTWARLSHTCDALKISYFLWTETLFLITLSVSISAYSTQKLVAILSHDFFHSPYVFFVSCLSLFFVENVCDSSFWYRFDLKLILSRLLFSLTALQNSQIIFTWSINQYTFQSPRHPMTCCR